MTMLYSLFTAQGIVFAADSQITAQGEKSPRPSQRKVFRVPHLGVAPEGGVIGFFGLAEVRSLTMSDWLRKLIAEPQRPGDVGEFGEYLVQRLVHDATPLQLEHSSGFHIGAFVREEGLALPVMRYASNIYGSYADVQQYYVDPQDHIARDWNVPRSALRDLLGRRQGQFGFPHWYRNGDLPNFAPLTNVVKEAIEYLVCSGHYFRAPSTIEDWQLLGRSLVVMVSQLHRVYHAGSPVSIGNRPVAVGVRWPV